MSSHTITLSNKCSLSAVHFFSPPFHLYILFDFWILNCALCMPRKKEAQKKSNAIRWKKEISVKRFLIITSVSILIFFELHPCFDFLAIRFVAMLLISHSILNIWFVRSILRSVFLYSISFHRRRDVLILFLLIHNKARCSIFPVDILLHIAFSYSQAYRLIFFFIQFDSFS